MSDSHSISITQTIHASPTEVCRGFTHSVLLRDWLSHQASSEPVEGGHLFLWWRNGRAVIGVYETVDPPNEVRFTWLEPQSSLRSVVQVHCAAEHDGTLLTLEHSGEVPEGQDGAQMEVFWREALENLASVIETGIDQRMARRPRLGILMDEFTPEIAQKLGVPVKEGVLLAGTAPESGAEAAGLLKDDVLVSLNGVSLKNPHSFDTALEGLKAGDCPMVEYYRGSEKFQVSLQLGTFPIPEFPANAQDLAARVRELDAEVLAAMRSLLEGLTDEEASRRPAENEWSVKELVVHFILCERDYQSWAADMLNDFGGDWLQMRPNVNPRIKALVDRLENLPALLDELALAKEETAATIENFPDSFVQNRKHLYHRLAQWELEFITGHYNDEHLEQFKTTIEVVKAG